MIYKCLLTADQVNLKIHVEQEIHNPCRTVNQTSGKMSSPSNNAILQFKWTSDKNKEKALKKLTCMLEPVLLS